MLWGETSRWTMDMAWPASSVAVAACDVYRPAAREQVQSLGARFVELPLEERAAGIGALQFKGLGHSVHDQGRITHPMKVIVRILHLERRDHDARKRWRLARMLGHLGRNVLHEQTQPRRDAGRTTRRRPRRIPSKPGRQLTLSTASRWTASRAVFASRLVQVYRGDTPSGQRIQTRFVAFRQRKRPLVSQGSRHRQQLG